ncbi:MAG: hypothetical protein OEU09_04495 [Rhodospirillales bacterium]|nr:hypothetical protein [Rhodospirillales bacterium]MDH3910534.1 hypothetical protein [Rhodospirillales bacterium]MDH3919818.1 hypothetical protein [Rhodospirillales bacterium]MDH3966616.1 hypothetical protein [Rhodospirillales bacterium]
MRVFRYPGRTLAGDYIRSVAGMSLGFGVLLSVPPTPAIIMVFGGVAGVFSLFGLRTVQRHVTKVAVTDAEICNVGFRTSALCWGDLGQIKLRYYGTKRQERGEGGFMQLTLKGGGRSMTYDSGIEGFKYIAWRAAKAARDNDLSVDPASAGNLLALGLDADGEAPPPKI